MSRGPADSAVAQVYFHYSPEDGLCQDVADVDPHCLLPAHNCTFRSVDECQVTCGTGAGHSSVIGGCAGTRYGCCGDGVTVKASDSSCPGMT